MSNLPRVLSLHYRLFARNRKIELLGQYFTFSRSHERRDVPYACSHDQLKWWNQIASPSVSGQDYVSLLYRLSEGTRNEHHHSKMRKMLFHQSHDRKYLRSFKVHNFRAKIWVVRTSTVFTGFIFQWLLFYCRTKRRKRSLTKQMAILRTFQNLKLNRRLE